MKNNFSVKIRPVAVLQIVNFLITILQIFCDSVIQSLKIFRFRKKQFIYAFLFFWTFDFERKKDSRIFLGHWSTKENYKFSKNIEKTPYRRVAQKKVQFCTRRRKSHFFTHPVDFILFYFALFFLFILFFLFFYFFFLC